MDRARDAAVHVWLVPDGQCAARQLLAAAGAGLLGLDPARVEVVTGAGGRPEVRTADGQVWVSLSHGAGTLAVAASLAGPVGVDIEGELRPAAAELARRWFDPAEADWLRDRPVRDFLLLWTAKEALGKALGVGLRGSGLRRRVPLPPVPDGSFSPVPGSPDGSFSPVPGSPDGNFSPVRGSPDGSFSAVAGGLWLAHLVPRAGLVLAVASGVPVPGLVLHDQVEGAGHVAPVRSTARSRLSLPVVVRGN